MTEKPSVLIVSSSNTKPKSLIKLLTKSQNVNVDPIDLNKITHSWLIDTKYYTAEIDIIGINEDFARSADFNTSVEALIIHMDTNKLNGLDDLKAWDNIEEDCDPEVKLLLANYCTSDTKVTRTQATEWCLQRGFELIELYPAEKGGADGVIEEKFGIERVVEALQAHTWSNLVMKDADVFADKAPPGNDKNYSIDFGEEFVSGEDTDDFTDLFSKLTMMKDSFQSMPMSQRKQCAEQMVTAFWKAIGGDEEEISDI